MAGPEESPDAELVSALQQANAALRKTNRGLREVINTQGVQIETLAAQLEAQAARIAELERRPGDDSSTSGRPPSSDSPYRKPARGWSRTSSGRRPGKQPGEPGSTMPLIDNPDEVVDLDPPVCGGCGAGLTGAPVTRVERRQVTDVTPPPPPHVTEYRIYTRTCPGCATAHTHPAPAGVVARAQYGPTVLARAAQLLFGHYLPVGRAAALMRSMLGVSVSTGFMASVRGRAARLCTRVAGCPQRRTPRCRYGLGRPAAPLQAHAGHRRPRRRPGATATGQTRSHSGRSSGLRHSMIE